ncbi:hypothetical protein [Lentibacter sp.]|uniref:hypothetical protein n=1 Tax=Lentibacter sp. TaxID=2024994 RepID=UPI003F6985E1
MEFIEKNKKLIVPVTAGAIIGLVLNWADLPAWMIGGAVAAVVTLWSGKLMETYDSKIAPKINARREEY